jgi:ElaB/YqjD/DUF883 family membrane-anchored ribosome-binding protein
MPLSKTTDKSAHLVDQAAQAVDQISTLAHRGMDSVGEKSHQLRVKVEQASDNTVSYIKQEPVKAVLIAAATGAALMGLVGLINRSRDRG